MITQVLKEQAPGVLVSEETAKRITTNNQTLLLHSLEQSANTLCYLFSEGYCHGIISVKDPIKISLSEFQNYYPQHRCTERQRKQWFQNKKVIFGYPVRVVSTLTLKANITPSRSLFTGEYELYEKGCLPHNEAKNFDFSRISHLPSSLPVLMYDTENNTFVISLEEHTSFSQHLASELLKIYGPSVPITYGKIKGNSYIPLCSFQAQKIQELQEVKNISPDIKELPNPSYTSMNFRDEKKYAVEKKFKGISVRIHHWKGKKEIREINGRDLSSVFPSLIDSLSEIENNNWIADGVLTFELEDKKITQKGKGFFSSLSHELCYYYGFLSQRKKGDTVTLSEDEMEVIESFEEYSDIDVEKTLQEKSLVFSLEQIQKNLDTIVPDSVFKIPDRFSHSFIRGVFEGTRGIIDNQRVIFSLKEKELSEYIDIHISQACSIPRVSEEHKGIYHLTYTGESAKEVMKYMYTAGPSTQRMKSHVSGLLDRPLCAHPDERFAVLWIHDLLCHEPW